MTHRNKIIINTIASYVKIIINAIAMIFTTRILLERLGAIDYGLFNLIAGTIAMMSFLNGALMVSGQRFYSIALGKKDYFLLNKYFNNSVFIHVIISIFTILILLLLIPILFNGFLDIEESKREIAIIIYIIMTISSALTLFGIPYSAMMNAYEDIGILAIFNIIQILLQLLGAIFLIYINNYLLLIYTMFTFTSILVRVLCEISWVNLHYKHIKHRGIALFDKIIFRQIFKFAGWNTLGSVAILIRSQGVAIVLNIFFGTIINAAYGIANQVNSLVLAFSASLTTVFTPSIIQAHGADDNNKMRFLSIFTSKLSFYLSSIMAIPLIIYTQEILCIWLEQIPKFTVSFCLLIIICFLIQMIYPGLNRAIYACGKIKNYQIWMSLYFILILPLGIILFQYITNPTYIIYLMILSQLAVMAVTIHYAHKYCGIDKGNYYKCIVCPSFILVIATVFIGLSLKSFIPTTLPLIIGISSIIIAIYTFFYYNILFSKVEKETINILFRNIINKVNDKKNY